MTQWGDDYPSRGEDDGDELEAGPDSSAQAELDGGADAPPPLYYSSVDEFVRLYLRLVYRRRVDGRHRCWAGRWWEYEEAIIRTLASLGTPTPSPGLSRACGGGACVVT